MEEGTWQYGKLGGLGAVISEGEQLNRLKVQFFISQSNANPMYISASPHPRPDGRG